MATLYDEAYPGATPPANVQGSLVYIGGDTPHVWTDAEIAAAHGRYRLPVYVRSNPQNADPVGDAGQAIAWLLAHRVPQGTAVVLDLETAIDPVYVLAFGNRLHAAGYKVWPYGSTSTLFANPVLDGYFAAEPSVGPSVEHIDPRTVMTQWLFAGGYDLDDTLATSVLWDYSPPAVTPAKIAPAAPPAAPPKEDDMATIYQGPSDILVLDNGFRYNVRPDALAILVAKFGAPVILPQDQFDVVASATSGDVVVPAPVVNVPAPVVNVPSGNGGSFPKSFTVTANS